MAEKKEELTSQQIINRLLGTNNKKDQAARVAALAAMQPVHLLIVANPVSGEISVSTGGSPGFDLLYSMIDRARDGIRRRENQALLAKASQEDTETPE